MAQAKFLSSTITSYRGPRDLGWRVGVSLEDIPYGDTIAVSLTPAEARQLAWELVTMATDAEERQQAEEGRADGKE